MTSVQGIKLQNALIFSGGGTLGSVTPLLALAQTIAQAYPHLPMVWMGTWRGVERRVVSRTMAYIPLCNGKFRRYFSFRTLTDPLLVLIGFFQSLILVAILRPRAVVSAGGFVAVPLHWAAWLLRIPSLAIQLDVTKGFAHILVQGIVSRVVPMVPAREGSNRIDTAIPVRAYIRDSIPHRATLRREAQRIFALRPEMPTIVVTGGGRGAVSLNHAVRVAAPTLLKTFNIIHITGEHDRRMPASLGYYACAFLEKELPLAYAAADVMIIRAGMATLAECAHLSLPCVVVPLPQSAQVKNAEYLITHHAAMVVLQHTALSEQLIQVCLRLSHSSAQRKMMGDNLHRAIPTDNGAFCITLLRQLRVL